MGGAVHLNVSRCKAIFLSYTYKLNQQCFKMAANIFLINMIGIPLAMSFDIPFEPITLGCCPF